jgi:hypothetical protein
MKPEAYTEIFNRSVPSSKEGVLKGETLGFPFSMLQSFRFLED